MLVVILIAAGVRGVSGMCLLAVHIILFKILVKSACVVRTLLNIIVHMSMGVTTCHARPQFVKSIIWICINLTLEI